MMKAISSPNLTCKTLKVDATNPTFLSFLRESTKQIR